MKKEELLNGLKNAIGDPDADGNYGETGLSLRTIESYVDNVLVPQFGEEEKVADDFYKNQAGFLKTVGGQLRHEKAEFAKNYKPALGNAGGGGGNSGEGGKEGELAAMTKKVNELVKSNKDLADRLNASETSKVQNELRKKIEAGMKAKNADDGYVLKNVLKGETFDTNKSVDELVEKYLKKYDTELAEARGNGGVPRANGNGGDGGGSAADDYFKRKAKREGWSHGKQK